MKLLKFKKGIKVINIPFMLSDLSDWRVQIEKEMRKIKSMYKVTKLARYGFEITEDGAVIKIYKR